MGYPLRACASAALCWAVAVAPCAGIAHARGPTSTPALIGGLTPAAAETKRDAIRAQATAKVEAGEVAEAAAVLADNAALLGDPVTYVEAGALYLQQADADRDVEPCARAIAVTTIALDILHFYAAVAAGTVKSTWQVIDPADAATMIEQAQAQLARARALVETIEDERAAAAAAAAQAARPVAVAPVPEPADADRERSPGTGLIAGGAVATVFGLGGVSMVVAGVLISEGKQKEVEKLMPPGNAEEVRELDREGKRGNLIAFIGAGVGALGLGVGVPLLLVGAKQRKQAGPSARAALRVMPVISRTSGGFSLRGRF